MKKYGFTARKAHPFTWMVRLKLNRNPKCLSLMAKRLRRPTHTLEGLCFQPILCYAWILYQEIANENERKERRKHKHNGNKQQPRTPYTSNSRHKYIDARIGTHNHRALNAQLWTVHRAKSGKVRHSKHTATHSIEKHKCERLINQWRIQLSEFGFFS